MVPKKFVWKIWRGWVWPIILPHVLTGRVGDKVIFNIAAVKLGNSFCLALYFMISLPKKVITYCAENVIMIWQVLLFNSVPEAKKAFWQIYYTIMPIKTRDFDLVTNSVGRIYSGCVGLSTVSHGVDLLASLTKILKPGGQLTYIQCLSTTEDPASLTSSVILSGKKMDQKLKFKINIFWPSFSVLCATFIQRKFKF